MLRWRCCETRAAAPGWPGQPPAVRLIPTQPKRLALLAYLALAHPRGFHRRDSLPLTANGKIDTKALAALAAELAVTDDDYHAPVTATERRLATAWAKVLGIAADQIVRWIYRLPRTQGEQMVFTRGWGK